MNTRTNAHTRLSKCKFTAEQIAEWNKKQLEIDFEDYDTERNEQNKS